MRVGSLTSTEWQSSVPTQVCRTPNSEPHFLKHTVVRMPTTPIQAKHSMSEIWLTGELDPPLTSSLTCKFKLTLVIRVTALSTEPLNTD